MLFPPAPQFGDQTIVSGNLYVFIKTQDQDYGSWYNLSQGPLKRYNNPPAPLPGECAILPQLIRIKRSSDAEAPESLVEGELAYSFASSTLFIGDKDGIPVKIS